jgi:hypothetical protein
MKKQFFAAFFLLCATTLYAADPAERPRAREAGVQTGILPIGKLNTITDVQECLLGIQRSFVMMT